MTNMFGNQDLIDNPTPRIPVCLCLDVSGSMGGSPIDELNKGVQAFFNAIKKDVLTRYSAEIMIIVFGGDQAQILVDFALVDSITVPKLKAAGKTPMADAVSKALERLEKRKDQYKTVGVPYYQPWLVLMTDGEPTDNEISFLAAAKKCSDLITQQKLTIFPILIGDSANKEKLEKFSPHRRALQLKGLNFNQFFEWLGASVSIVSKSNPGDTNIKLDLSSLSDWAKL